MKFSLAIKNLIDDLGITQIELSNRLQVSQSYLNNMCSGYRKINLTILNKLQNLKNVNPSIIDTIIAIGLKEYMEDKFTLFNSKQLKKAFDLTLSSKSKNY